MAADHSPEEPAGSGDLKADPSRELRRKHMLALGTVAGMTIISQLFVQHVIATQKRDGPVINMAGRQRMLSQKISKAALALQTTGQNRETRLQELTDAAALWRQSHHELRFVQAEANSPEVERQFAELQPHHDAMVDAVEGILKANETGEPTDVHIATILKHEVEFLPRMHRIVGTLDREAQQRVAMLKWIELTLMSLTLLVLLLEGLLVFEPVLRTIRRQYREAIEAAREIAGARRIEKLNASLQEEVERRRRSEGELQASYAKINHLSLIASRTRHSVMVTDPEGRLEYVNDAFEALTGLKREEVLGRKPGPLLQGPETDRETAATIREHLRNREHLDVEILNYSRSGTPYWIQLEIEPVLDARGKLLHFLGTQVDITERKRQQQEIRDVAEKFRTIFNSSRDAVMTLDATGFIDCNQATLDLFGYSTVEEFCQNHPAEVSPEFQPDGRHSEKAANAAIAGAFQSGSNRFDWRHRRSDGTEFDAEVLLSAYTLEGEPVMQASVRDISVRREEERQLKWAKQQAENANRAKSEFLTNISHEMRTPLNAILGFTEMLEESGSNEEQRGQFLATISSSGHRLLELIDNLLDLSNIEAGEMTFSVQPCSPKTLVEEIVTSFQPAIERKRLTFDCACSHDLPTTVLTDPARLQQLLRNLIGNAVKFTEAGGVRVSVGFEDDGHDSMLTLEIADTGVGISADKIEEVFSPFVQADASITRRFGGTGLGLTLSRQIVRGLDGDITVESEVGRGTTFQVRLPVQAVIEAEHSRETIDDPQGNSLPVPSHVIVDVSGNRPDLRNPLRGLKVLLHEPEPLTRRLLSLMLRRLGTETTIVQTERECAERVNNGSEAFDVVIVNEQVANPTGMPVDAEEVSPNPNDRKPVVVVISDGENRFGSSSEGAVKILHKPIVPDTLAKILTEAIRNEVAPV